MRSSFDVNCHNSTEHLTQAELEQDLPPRRSRLGHFNGDFMGEVMNLILHPYSC